MIGLAIDSPLPSPLSQLVIPVLVFLVAVPIVIVLAQNIKKRMREGNSSE